MIDQVLRTRMHRRPFPNVQLLLAVQIAAVSALSLSAILWSVVYDVNPVPSQSEFFAYSWVYGVRWGAGEAIFQPHSQLLFPIFAALNWLFRPDHNPESVFHQWKMASQYWPAFMMVLSLAFIYLTTNLTFYLADASFASLIYVVCVPVFIDQTDLFSVSYHSLSVPLALGALWFWKFYESDLDRAPPFRFFLCLGIYTAICALGKPTFVAFASPFFAMEAVKAVKAKSGAIAAQLILSAAVAIAIYLTYLLAFYGSINGFISHFWMSRAFMLSQYHWYDQAKGANPFEWYRGYVVGVMGLLPSILIAVSIALACLPKSRAILLSGAAAAFGFAMYVLYHRSQLHGHPEFIALLATTTIGVFRCCGLLYLAPVRLIVWFETWVGAIASATVIVLIFALTFPLATPQRSYMETMAKYDVATLPAIFQQPPAVRTIAMFKYPDVFFGTADVWCRGASNLFDPSRSPAIDELIPGAGCAGYTQASTTSVGPFNRIVFVQRSSSDQQQAISNLIADFPQTSVHLHDCSKATSQLQDKSFILQCSLAHAVN